MRHRYRRDFAAQSTVSPIGPQPRIRPVDWMWYFGSDQQRCRNHRLDHVFRMSARSSSFQCSRMLRRDYHRIHRLGLWLAHTPPSPGSCHRPQVSISQTLRTALNGSATYRTARSASASAPASHSSHSELMPGRPRRRIDAHRNVARLLLIRRDDRGTYSSQTHTERCHTRSPPRPAHQL